MSREQKSTVSDRGLMSARAAALLMMTCLLITLGLMFASEPGSAAYRTSQGGLLAFSVACFGLLPVRVLLWRAQRSRQGIGEASERKYRWSDRFYFDLLLAIGLVVVIFLVDHAALPATALRIGVASALGLAAALAAGRWRRRKAGKDATR